MEGPAGRRFRPRCSCPHGPSAGASAGCKRATIGSTAVAGYAHPSHEDAVLQPSLSLRQTSADSFAPAAPCTARGPRLRASCACRGVATQSARVRMLSHIRPVPNRRAAAVRARLPLPADPRSRRQSAPVEPPSSRPEQSLRTTCWPDLPIIDTGDKHVRQEAGLAAAAEKRPAQEMFKEMVAVARW